jgi:hypothetical protein
MGMTIDDTINAFQYFQNHPTTDDKEVIKSGQELFETAIDTMRKYQKIQEILKDIPYGGEATVRRIQEVVEDGKID